MVRRINLVPATQRRRTSTDFGLVGLIAGALLVIGLIGLSYFYFSGIAADRDAELADLQAQRQQIEAQLAQLAKYEALQQEVIRTEGLVQSVYAGRTLLSSLLGDISLVVPDTVWFQSLSITAPEIAPPSATGEAEAGAADPAAATGAPSLGSVTISGKTYSYEDVATLLVRLQQIPSLKNVVLDSAATDGDGGDALKTFSITAELANETQDPDMPLPLAEVEVSN
ncbi:MAG: hypothetical protein Kow00129_13200 [Thermoleophilia bacterium]